jgi:hypothetical protein
VSRGDILFDTGFAVAVQGAEETEKMSETLISYEIEGVKTVSVIGDDGKRYVLALNVTDEAVEILASTLGAKSITSVDSGVACEKITLEVGEAALVSLIK